MNYKAFLNFKQTEDMVLKADKLFPDRSDIENVLTPVVFRDASIELKNEKIPEGIYRTLISAIENATEFKIILPIFISEVVKVYIEKKQSNSADVNSIFAEEISPYIADKFEQEANGTTANNGHIGCQYSGSMPLTVLSIYKPTNKTVIAVHNDSGSIQGLIKTRSADTTEWANNLFEEYREHGSEVTL